MKRIIASILTLLLLLSLCACGGNKENNKTETNNQTSATESKKQEESTAGETVTEPEKTFDTENTEKLYLRFTTTTDEKTNEFEYAFDQITDDTYLLYVSNGMLKNNEIVYEVGDTEIKKYEKSALQENFSLATLSYDESKNEVDTHMKLVAMFLNGFEGAKGLEYKKQGDFNAPGTGEAWMYDVYEDSKKIAEVMINKETGLYSKIKMEDGSMTYTLSEYKLSGFTIPEYK